MCTRVGKRNGKHTCLRPPEPAVAGHADKLVYQRFQPTKCPLCPEWGLRWGYNRCQIPFISLILRKFAKSFILGIVFITY